MYFVYFLCINKIQREAWQALIAMGFRIRKGSKGQIYIFQIRQSQFFMVCGSFAGICQILKNKGGACLNMHFKPKANLMVNRLCLKPLKSQHGRINDKSMIGIDDDGCRDALMMAVFKDNNGRLRICVIFDYSPIKTQDRK